MIKSMNNIGGDRTKLQFCLCTLTEVKENGRENAKTRRNYEGYLLTLRTPSSLVASMMLPFVLSLPVMNAFWPFSC